MIGQSSDEYELSSLVSLVSQNTVVGQANPGGSVVSAAPQLGNSRKLAQPQALTGRWCPDETGRRGTAATGTTKKAGRQEGRTQEL